ncbi:uncharacterized protein C19orf44 homolog [Symphorus nematophorus]
MWKLGGRSSALDRAQALLSAKRCNRGDSESVQGSTAGTREHKGAVGAPSASNPRTSLSDLSDLSSASSAPEHGADTVGTAAAGKTLGREGGSTQDVRPQSSLGGRGSRFLKKPPPPAANSSQSPNSMMQQVFEPRCRSVNVSSSLQGSQTAALSRLAQIESRIRSRNQARQGPKTADNLTSDLGMSPPQAARSLEASVQLSAQSSSEQSQRGKRFLKPSTAVSNSNAAAARAPQDPHVGGRSRSRVADAVVPSVGVETKSLREVKGLSLESDKEDMRNLLGDSLDSPDNSYLIPVRPSSRRTADKLLSKSSQRVHSTPPPAAVTPSSSTNTAAPHSPASPSSRSSPFRFTGQAQAHFSPSVLSKSPPLACVSPSPTARLNSSHRARGPQHSLSSMSGHSEVLSLEELFPVGPASEEPHSEMSAVSSEDFKIKVMTLDDLVTANLGFPEETPGKEVDHDDSSGTRECKISTPVPGSLNTPQLLRLKEKKKGEEQQQEEEEEDMLEYQSDFESESSTEPDYSASQVSEHLQGHGDGEEVVLEIREEASDTDVSCGRANNDYSSIFSDISCSYSSQTSDHSWTLSRSRDSRSSRSSESHSSRNFSHQSRRCASIKTVLKEAAVQTKPDTWLTGRAVLGPAVSMANMDATPVVAHILSAEMVEALSTFNPAVFALNEILKQQLAMTRQFIVSSRHLHSSLLQSLEPPNYRYTTLEDTKKYICRHRPPKLTMNKALEEVLQEMRDHHHT